MKVLIIARGYADTLNLVGVFELDQAKALKEAGCDVRIIAFDSRSIKHIRKWGCIVKEINGIKVYVCSFQCRLLSILTKGEILKKIYYHIFLKATKDDWIPDIIHAHFGINGFNALTIKEKLPKSKFVITEHFSGMNTLNPKTNIIVRSLSAYISADALIAVSTCLAKNLKFSTSLDFMVIPNMLDELFCTNIVYPKKKNVCGTIRLVSVGNLIPVKQFPLLVRIVGKLKHNVQLDIFGEGAERGSIEKEIIKNNLSDSIKLHGRVGRELLFQYYKSANAFILLSKSETFGVSFIEAMGVGLPVVSLECGGTDDFITNKTGVVIKSQDEKIITEEVDQFLNKLDTYDSKSIADYVKSNYSSTVVANRLLNLYKHVLKQK